MTVHPYNLGLVHSLNEGLSLCTGEFIARMDGDDISLPYRLEHQVGYMEAHPEIGVCGSQALYLGEEQTTAKPLTHEEIKCWQLFYCTIVHPSVMIRKSILDSYGIRYLEVAYAEDYEIWSRLAEVTRLANLPDVLIKYRAHPNQVSSLYQAVQEQSAESVRRNQLLQLGLDATSDEYLTHKDFCCLTIRVHDYAAYMKALAWAHKILEANLRTPRYEHQTLNMVLSQCFSRSQ